MANGAGEGGAFCPLNDHDGDERGRKNEKKSADPEGHSHADGLMTFVGRSDSHDVKELQAMSESPIVLSFYPALESSIATAASSDD